MFKKTINYKLNINLRIIFLIGKKGTRVFFKNEERKNKGRNIRCVKQEPKVFSVGSKERKMEEIRESLWFLFLKVVLDNNF